MKQIWNSFKIAFAMYSKIPMPKSDWTKENMRYTMCFFPAVGLVIGGLTWLWGVWGRNLAESHIFYTVILLLIPVAVTGGIHLDGLLDTSDALSSYQERERKLEILKDSHAGAFAIIIGITYFLLYFGIYSELTLQGLPVVCLSFVLSRCFSGLSIAAFPMAKNTGLAATFSDGAQKQTVRITTVAWGLLTILLMCLYQPLLGACAAIGGMAAFVFYYRMSMKQFGGITGDLAGFFLQICELVMALCVVAGEILLRKMA
ncbi:adenosylcobinamide-GDP ribazoletransferase [Lactonifactor longoviformis]|uniref:Adenosylcobinamide-GDP ribazoletransferase n=1 Tax=Lactonifactor longoviformis DSM 17459 TaxID=1122155 RepID=A0A1M5AH36_9CLOT|nr:adenosylcobinamide-GDP ribazoletransferase [Lactonifactor longoviformis]POP31661.1 adenosylcobinamide-GDP ribazoletransferase [Lactonifactor longoviformis]SHF29599.1 cobalamin-5'-phosphate synthase [Lactonifactor longoviformis DSM 17459]